MVNHLFNQPLTMLNPTVVTPMAAPGVDRPMASHGWRLLHGRVRDHPRQALGRRGAVQTALGHAVDQNSKVQRHDLSSAAPPGGGVALGARGEHPTLPRREVGSLSDQLLGCPTLVFGCV